MESIVPLGMFAPGLERHRADSCSASTGVVNIYETSEIASHVGSDENLGLLPVTPKPLRELMNLTTSVSTMAFNHDAQILAIASDKKKDAFRMVSAEPSS
jgi:U3 small nucleolar RNA-associated protein 18